jgi:site-specific DNA-methyltransferase (adenine-specific)
MHYEVLHGDCRKFTRKMEPDHFDSCVTDPPYGVSYLGRKWDKNAPGLRYWQRIIRVMRPGAIALVFGSTREWHRVACAMEEAGFTMRDTIVWLHGRGMPKGLDVSRTIDKELGVERKVVGKKKAAGPTPITRGIRGEKLAIDDTVATSEEAQAWDGWYTTLAPAWDPILVMQKPITGTITKNILQHGTGAINVDGCSVDEKWPGNVVLDGIAASMLGGPMRFFFCARATQQERNAGLKGMPLKATGSDMSAKGAPNFHPTVKPLALMRWLVRLVTPPGGLVLDPFCGSGSTGCGAVQEGRSFVGIEREEEFCAIARRRIEYWAGEDPKALRCGRKKRDVYKGKRFQLKKEK